MDGLFQRMADLAMKTTGRMRAEYDSFFEFYREVVETMPAEVATLFGGMKAPCSFRDNDKLDYSIEITVADYLWWKREYANGVRFKERPSAVKTRMLEHLAKQIEKSTTLEPDERKSLLALLVDEEK